MLKRKEKTLRCSFCKKTAAEVDKLIAGPKVYICDACVAVCNDILAHDRLAAPEGAAPGSGERTCM